MDVKWTDPTAGIAVVLLALVGVLLLTGHDVPAELYAALSLAIGFFFGSHGSLASSQQVLSAVGNGAGAALTGQPAQHPPRSTDAPGTPTSAADPASAPPAPVAPAPVGGSD